MFMLKTAGALAIIASFTVPTAAEAQRVHGRVVSLQGANGRGGVITTSVIRGGGTVSSARSVQTNRGHGATTVRSRSRSDGVFQGSRTTTMNNGASFGRDTMATANGNGSVSLTSTRTGPRGRSSTVSATVRATRN
ncbi:MAG: hypothetical protein KYX69_10430 [Sphingomonas sp.]|uniref:hypothetical protein n=1 Tax=Sphingomonas sp. TaxID=28214 RepID=UPI0026055BBA|nr:hypothetical protein [Sphingomonas sp.]MDK2768119.1 hypothetical protein [Sphingomonas sp.]